MIASSSYFSSLSPLSTHCRAKTITYVKAGRKGSFRSSGGREEDAEFAWPPNSPLPSPFASEEEEEEGRERRGRNGKNGRVFHLMPDFLPLLYEIWLTITTRNETKTFYVVL